MAASIHVKSRSRWKPVKIDPKLYNDKHFGGLICVEELRDYELVKSFSNDKETGTERASEKKSKLKQVGGKSNTSSKSKLKRKLDGNEVGSASQVKKSKNTGTKKTENTEESPSPSNNPSDVKISRKKKKLLKWKQKARLRKEALRAKVVGGQEVITIGTSEEAKTEDEVKLPDKTLGDGKIKPKNTKKKKVKAGKRTAAPGSPVRKPTAPQNPSTQNSPTASMSAWADLHVPEPVLTALSELRFTSPTPIQILALPSAIRDKMDIVGAAQTGSGKTLAFAIPVIHHILRDKERRKGQSPADVDRSGGSMEAGSETRGDVNDVTDETSGDDISDSESDDVGDGESDAGSEDSEDGEFDNPPDEEDVEDFETDGTGLVKVMNNVEFDWPIEPTNEKAEPHSGCLLCLVLTPTRELAVQVKNHIEAVAKYTDIKVGLVVGGMAPQKQKRLLKRCPEIVVATPGRLWELIEEGDSYLSEVGDLRYLVIDEADRMVEKGHFEELSILLERINADESKKKKRQTFVFSATLTVIHSTPNRFMAKKKKQSLTSEAKLEKLMSKVGMRERPKVIDLSGRVGTADTLTEAKIHCATDEKDSYLYYLTRQYPGRTLVFANSKDCVRRLLSVFTLLNRNPLTLHADMHQKQRLKNLERFTGDDSGLLLATDVAARGLDIPNVQHVIHYQVPRTTENYVHRSGRTARAYKEGLSVMLIGPEDLKNYKKIIYTLNKNEDLPMFPVEYQYHTELRDRVSLARQIDSQGHRFSKLKHQNDWFHRAAQEVDIELDEQIVMNDLGDEGQQANLKERLRQMKGELARMLKQPLSSYSFSGKYPTRSGRLELPKLPALGENAIAHVKKDRAFQSQVLRRPSRPKQRLGHKRKRK